MNCFAGSSLRLSLNQLVANLIIDSSPLPMKNCDKLHQIFVIFICDAIGSIGDTSGGFLDLLDCLKVVSFSIICIISLHFSDSRLSLFGVHVDQVTYVSGL